MKTNIIKQIKNAASDISIHCTQILSNLHVGSYFKLSCSTLPVEMIKWLSNHQTVFSKIISLKFMAFYTLYVHYVLCMTLSYYLLLDHYEREINPAICWSNISSLLCFCMFSKAGCYHLPQPNIWYLFTSGNIIQPPLLVAAATRVLFRIRLELPCQ